MTFLTLPARLAAVCLLGLAALPASAAPPATPSPAFGLIVGYREAADELRREETDRGPWAGDRERAQAVWQRAVKRSRERTGQLARDTGVRVKSVGEAGRAALMRFDQPLKGRDLDDALRRVRMHPDVAWVEPDVLVRRQQNAAPNDTYFSSQWHLAADGAGFESSMNLPGAWATSNGTNVVVAVVDSGILAHPDLLGKTVTGYDFVSEMPFSNDGNGRDGDPTDPGDWVDRTGNPAAIQQLVDNGTCGDFTADPSRDRSSWHGTFIAGQIAALSNNGQGVTGLNWAARILPVRVSGRCGALVSDLLDGVRWAAGLSVANAPVNNNPAKVINLSFGGDAACSPAYQDMVDDVTDAGALLVVAAGNQDGPLTRPADCQGVLAVAAVRRDGAKAWYSSFGSNIALSAPGGSDQEVDSTNATTLANTRRDHLIRSTDNPGATTAVSYTGMSDDDAYGYKQGTSFAAPQAAGVASLLLAVNNALTPGALIERLKATARPWTTVSPPVASCGPAGAEACRCTTATCGAGLLDAAAAMGAAARPAAVIQRIGSVLPGALITLNGASSVAYNGSILTYQWTQVSGPAVTIPTANQANTSLSLPSVEGRYVFRLTVTDAGAPGSNTGTDTVTVVAAYPASGGGGGMGWWWGLGLWAWVLAMAAGGRRQRG